MSKIVLYTIPCGRRGNLERMLIRNNIPYSRVTDENILREKNLEFFPAYEIDGVMYDYKEAKDYLEAMCSEQGR